MDLTCAELLCTEPPWISHRHGMTVAESVDAARADALFFNNVIKSIGRKRIGEIDGRTKHRARERQLRSKSLRESTSSSMTECTVGFSTSRSAKHLMTEPAARDRKRARNGEAAQKREAGEGRRLGIALAGRRGAHWRDWPPHHQWHRADRPRQQRLRGVCR